MNMCIDNSGGEHVGGKRGKGRGVVRYILLALHRIFYGQAMNTHGLNEIVDTCGDQLESHQGVNDVTCFQKGVL